MVSEENRRMAAYTIEKMMKGRRFSICDVDSAAKLMGREFGGELRAKLSAIHCVDWGDIPEDIMRRLPSWLNQALSGHALQVTDLPCLREGNNELPPIEDSPIPRIGS